MEQMRQLLMVVAVVSVAAPALASDEQDCFQGQQPQQRIEGCSALIQRAPKDATLYHNRAVAHGQAGDVDSAIADYSKAIEFEPSNASAYDNRGRAYAMKGDHARAAEDQTKAEELLAKTIGQPNTAAPKASDTASTAKTAKAQPKAKAKASKNAAKEEPASGWGWLLNPFGGGANQTGAQTGAKSANP
jgi:tetratricopeptide (TPR) repeat protein